MICGIGTDIVVIRRTTELYDRHGDRALEKLLAPEERDNCRKDPNPGRFLAKRFAAKEAVSKAFGCGVGKTLGWLEMEVINDDLGAPHIVFHGGGLGLAEQRGVRQVFVSLTHTDQYAAASATLAG